MVPSECYILFTSQKHKEVDPSETYEVEPIYTTEFAKSKLNDEFLQQLKES